MTTRDNRTTGGSTHLSPMGFGSGGSVEHGATWMAASGWGSPSGAGYGSGLSGIDYPNNEGHGHGSAHGVGQGDGLGSGIGTLCGRGSYSAAGCDVGPEPGIGEANANRIV